MPNTSIKSMWKKNANCKFATNQRPPSVARCYRKSLPQCSTPPNKMILYQTYAQPITLKNLKKMRSIFLPKFVIYKSKKSTFLKS